MRKVNHESVLTVAQVIFNELKPGIVLTKAHTTAAFDGLQGEGYRISVSETCDVMTFMTFVESEVLADRRGEKPIPEHDEKNPIVNTLSRYDGVGPMTMLYYSIKVSDAKDKDKIRHAIETLIDAQTPQLVPDVERPADLVASLN